MCQTQKEAMFNLIIVALALATVLALYPFLGQRAVGGFAMLGFLGFGPLFYRRYRGQVMADERDQLIRRRSTVIAYSIFWLAFVASSMLALVVYGGDGAVPVRVVVSAVWPGLMLVVGTHAIATLVQYGRGGLDARS
jgi:hypothetical protein